MPCGYVTGEYPGKVVGHDPCIPWSVFTFLRVCFCEFRYIHSLIYSRVDEAV